MIKALIIEDENYLAEDLRNRLNKLDPEIEVMETLGSLKIARNWLNNNKEPDLIFMDVQLGDGISFELFENFELKCPVIFVTAYDQYAIKAFRVNGLDYLLKPLDDEALVNALNKYKLFIKSGLSQAGNIGDLMGSLNGHGRKFKESFLGTFRNQLIPIKTDEIAFFWRDSLNYIYTFGGANYHLDFTTLDEVEDLLDFNKFYRANRQFIINFDIIKHIIPLDSKKIKVVLKQPYQEFLVEVSREKAPGFKKWLDR